MLGEMTIAEWMPSAIPREKGKIDMVGLGTIYRFFLEEKEMDALLPDVHERVEHFLRRITVRQFDQYVEGTVYECLKNWFRDYKERANGKRNAKNT